MHKVTDHKRIDCKTSLTKAASFVLFKIHSSHSPCCVHKNSFVPFEKFIISRSRNVEKYFPEQEMI